MRGRRLSPSAIGVEELLNLSFNLLVLTLTGMLEHDLPTFVDDILRRPILIVVGVPRCKFVVLRHRVSDTVALDGGLYGVGGLLESKLRRVDTNDDEALVLVGVVEPSDVGQRVDTVVAGRCVSRNRPRRRCRAIPQYSTERN